MRFFLQAVLFMLFLCCAPSEVFCGYSKWEKNVVRNGIEFEKLRYSDSGTIIGYLKADTDIDNYPCSKGWIHFYKDWALQNFTLKNTMEINGIEIPAGTWVGFNNEGELKKFAFPDDTEVNGIMCMGTGGPKGAQTSFYTNGSLKYFFSRKKIEINDIPCKGGVFYIIGFHENGQLKKCTLCDNCVIKGKKYKKDSNIEFDEKGNVVYAKKPFWRFF